jgi:pimeloyl-ACP methyl ester carboxylesterase
MPRVTANGIGLEYETVGSSTDPALLLVGGLSAQLIDWQEDFAQRLAGQGFYVIRFDNRDAGKSTWLDNLPVPDIAELLAGKGKAPYSLADMGDDATALLGALDIEAAHVVGASMGGMIVQRMVIDHPATVLSMTSIMSTTGDPNVGQISETALASMLRPPATDRESAIAEIVAGYRAIGAPGFPATDEELRARATSSYDRGYHPAGSARQLAALLTASDRTEALHDVRVPVMVIHGEADPLVDISGGRATAAAISGAELLIIPGMGHNQPAGAWPQIIDAIVGNTERLQRYGSATATT